jgi:protease I
VGGAAILAGVWLAPGSLTSLSARWRRGARSPFSPKARCSRSSSWRAASCSSSQPFGSRVATRRSNAGSQTAAYPHRSATSRTDRLAARIDGNPHGNEEKGDEMADLNGKRVAILATDMFEQVELVEPRKAVEAAGAEVELVSLETGEIQGYNHHDKADTFPVDKVVADVSADDYDALLLPGGVGNPDSLRMDDDAVGFVRDFYEQGKPIAAICHAPWMLVEAGIVRDHKLTSFWSLQTDIRNAGGNWVDEELVVDEGIVTSRSPDDLPAFCPKVVEEFAEGTHERRGIHAEATAS